MSGRSLGQVIAAGLFAAGLTFGIAHASSRGARRVDVRNARAKGAAVRLASPSGTYVFHPGSGHIVATTTDKTVSRELALDLVVDGEPRPLTLERSADRATERNAFGATFGITIGDEVFDALIDLRVDPPTGALLVDLAVYADASAEEPLSPGLDGKAAHQFALRLHVPSGPRAAFVSGLGEVSDLGAAPAQSGRFLEIDADPHALGVASATGALDIAEGTLDQHAEITAATKSQAATPDHAAQTGLRFLYAPSSTAIWKSVYQLAGEATARVAGVVTGSNERARIFGLDAEGLPRVRAQVDPAGRFEVFVPPSVSLWYAAIDAARVSTPVVFPPGTPWDLRLDVSPGGEVDVKVTDADTGLPLLSRVIVHGIDGTLDPSFGPDYRASGAGPLVDALHGEITTPLPAGRYRVSATRGLEWSIDAKTIDIVSGRSAAVDLALRHVVPTPGVVSCDLHVHARPSFDTPVLGEDRVLSLVSAGIDFAVPSEHNIVGDYGPALQALDLTRDLATVQGVEITTFAPRFGHFGLYPYSGPKTPPYKATTVNKIFDFAHRKAPGAILQVNHPRLTKSIGYFDIFHFDPHRAPPYGMRTDFDALEVYNGYDLGSPDRVDAVLQDWFVLLNLGHRYAATGSSDSHRIQYQWAGYPRTMAVVGEAAAGDAEASSSGKASPIDTAAVIAAIRKGHSFVTSGPMLEFELNGARPGDELVTEETVLHGHVRVRAAPWVDVDRLEVIVGGKSVETVNIPSRPLVLGPELGDRAEAEARTIRYDADLTVTIPPGPESTRPENSWVLVIARGDRKLDDALPFMPVPPRAFTNPIHIVRAGAP